MTKNKIRIDLEELLVLRKRRIEISSIPIEQIEFYFNNEPFPIKEDIIQDLKFSGLSPINIIDFLDSSIDCAIASEPVLAKDWVDESCPTEFQQVIHDEFWSII